MHGVISLPDARSYDKTYKLKYTLQTDALGINLFLTEFGLLTKYSRTVGIAEVHCCQTKYSSYTRNNCSIVKSYLCT